MNANAPQPHPWIVALQNGLDALELALLAGDPAGVEKASAQVQGVLQQAPKTAEFAVPGTLRIDMERAAQRFGQLRQAVLRSQAQSQRAVRSILPQTAQPTYGAMAGRGRGSTGGAGQGFLRA
jgi:hypothetical protein